MSNLISTFFTSVRAGICRVFSLVRTFCKRIISWLIKEYKSNEPRRISTESQALESKLSDKFKDFVSEHIIGIVTALLVILFGSTVFGLFNIESIDDINAILNNVEKISCNIVTGVFKGIILRTKACVVVSSTFVICVIALVVITTQILVNIFRSILISNTTGNLRKHTGKFICGGGILGIGIALSALIIDKSLKEIRPSFVIPIVLAIAFCFAVPTCIHAFNIIAKANSIVTTIVVIVLGISNYMTLLVSVNYVSNSYIPDSASSEAYNLNTITAMLLSLAGYYIIWIIIRFVISVYVGINNIYRPVPTPPVVVH